MINDLQQLRGVFRDTTIFVVGCGPSLGTIPFALSSPAVVVNAAADIVTPTIWCSLEAQQVRRLGMITDPIYFDRPCTRGIFRTPLWLLSVRQYQQEIRSRASWCQVVTRMNSVLLYSHTNEDPLVATRENTIGGHSSSMILGISLAILMGADRICLLGADCCFDELDRRRFYKEPLPDLNNSALVKLGGGRWSTVDLMRIKRDIEITASRAEKEGISIIDCTRNGILEIPKGKLVLSDDSVGSGYELRVAPEERSESLRG